MKDITFQTKIRSIFLGIVILNLLLIGIQLVRSPSLLLIPGSWARALAPMFLLVLYGLVVFWITSKTELISSAVIRTGAFVGASAGAIEALNLFQENFLNFGETLNRVFAIGFMVGVFLLWGLASFLVVRGTRSVTQGILASVWAAMVTILFAVLLGFTLEFYVHPPAPADVATWGEFIRSGWKNIPAFTVANTLDSATTHLYTAPIVAIIFGGLAGVIAKRKLFFPYFGTARRTKK